ncbi:MAG: type II toxin-antitoxin system RelE/ParE family toxin [Defluviitaleaceae bacterium]|nr:type II toxin-antitoxin system RelE/ParE family toxin [Defluviitaleaceae bacterium]
MSDFKVNVPKIFRSDVDVAVARKKEFNAYESNIEEFKKEVSKRIALLKTSPKMGANLSARVDRETNIKYFVIGDYLLFYEIVSDEVVEVLRFLSAKSNWYNKLF